ncbi:hypothetical protein [Dyadobacter diqingensis]|uniref:hypothetical protein n=1 Tax=Dyadobacter diqingensis TaxID=2938121 RepID=UPI0020C4CD53|nr:hypothetical protein [Dyadobacter diqingensis]
MNKNRHDLVCGFYRFKAGMKIYYLKEENRSLREESRALEFLPAHKEDLKYQLEEKKASGSGYLDSYHFLVTLSLI